MNIEEVRIGRPVLSKRSGQSLPSAKTQKNKKIARHARVVSDSEQFEVYCVHRHCIQQF